MDNHFYLGDLPEDPSLRDLNRELVRHGGRPVRSRRALERELALQSVKHPEVQFDETLFECQLYINTN